MDLLCPTLNSHSMLSTNLHFLPRKLRWKLPKFASMLSEINKRHFEFYIISVYLIIRTTLCTILKSLVYVMNAAHWFCQFFSFGFSLGILLFLYFIITSVFFVPCVVFRHPAHSIKDVIILFLEIVQHDNVVVFLESLVHSNFLPFSQYFNLNDHIQAMLPAF